MLSTLKLKEAKGHHDLTLNFSPGINVLYGETDTGKTGALKSALWAMTNCYPGEKMINRKGAKSCEVTITVPGHTITRQWSKSSNTYVMDDVTYGAFRTGVPEPISAALNISEINIQRRRDLPFMVYWKASENADQFSQMMDIAEINLSISNINRMVKEAKDTVAMLLPQLESNDALLMACPDTAEALKELDALIRAEEELKQLSDSADELGVLEVQYHGAEQRISSLCDAPAALKELDLVLFPLAAAIDSLTPTGRQYQALEDKALTAARQRTELESGPVALVEVIALLADADKLTALRMHGNELEGLFLRYEAKTARIAQLSAGAEATESLAEITVLVEKVTALQAQETNMRTRLEMFGRAYTEAQQAKESFTQITARWDKEMPEICPLCDQPIGTHTHEA